MAFVLKLSPQDTEALRLQAEREHRSMHEVARLAVQERIGTAERISYLRTLAAQIHAEDEDALRILGEI
jgi:hypothetical protein